MERPLDFKLNSNNLLHDLQTLRHVATNSFSSLSNSHKVKLNRATFLPPYTNTYVSVPIPETKDDCMLCPNARIFTQHGFCELKLINLPVGKAHIHVANPRPVSVTLPKDLCYVHAITHVSDTEASMSFSERQAETRSQLDKIDINPHLTSDQNSKISDLIVDYADVFACNLKQIGKAKNTAFRIDTGDAAPTSCPPYKKSPAEKRTITAEINKIMEAELIRPSNSPWSASMSLVKKTDSGEWRSVIDYRKLNSITRKDQFPMALISEILSSLYASEFFFIMDLSGFHQIPIAEDSIAKTAFNTHDGLFEYLYLGFGLSNGSAFFNRYIRSVQGNLYGSCLAYLDDVLVYSSTFDEHLIRFQNVFEKLRENNLRLKPTVISLRLVSIF